jgi:hypothetical protein
MASWLTTQNQTSAHRAGIPIKSPSKRPRPTECAATNATTTAGTAMMTA